MSLYLYSGSFSPLHHGHLSIAQYVEEKYHTDVIFEFCINPYDKPELTRDDVLKRKRQFEILDRKVEVSTNTSFLQKALDSKFYLQHSFVGQEKYFIVGYDTIQRIDNKKYYFGSEKEKSRSLFYINTRKWKFIVFPRGGKIDEGLSEQIKEMCIFERDYEEIDISSSSIRKSKTILDINNYGVTSYLDKVLINEYFCFAKNIYKKISDNKDDTSTVQLNEDFIKLPKKTIVSKLWEDLSENNL